MREWIRFSLEFGFSLSSDTPPGPRSAPNAIRGKDPDRDAAAWDLAAKELADGAFHKWPDDTPTAPSQLRYASFFGVPKPTTPVTFRAVSDQSAGGGSVNKCTHRPSFVGLRLASIARLLRRVTDM